MQQRRENLLWSDTLPALLGGELKFNAANEVEGIVEVDGAAAAAVDGMAASKWKKAFGLERKDRTRCVVTDADMQGAWHIRFKQVAGGYVGQPFQRATFVSERTNRLVTCRITCSVSVYCRRHLTIAHSCQHKSWIVQCSHKMEGVDGGAPHQCVCYTHFACCLCDSAAVQRARDGHNSSTSTLVWTWY